MRALQRLRRPHHQEERRQAPWIAKLKEILKARGGYQTFKERADISTRFLLMQGMLSKKCHCSRVLAIFAAHKRSMLWEMIAARERQTRKENQYTSRLPTPDEGPKGEATELVAKEAEHVLQQLLLQQKKSRMKLDSAFIQWWVEKDTMLSYIDVHR